MIPYITVSKIPLSDIISFTDDAMAIIMIAGSMATAPEPMCLNTSVFFSQTTSPAMIPPSKKVTAKIGIASPEIARMDAIKINTTSCAAKKIMYALKILLSCAVSCPNAISKDKRFF